MATRKVGLSLGGLRATRTALFLYYFEKNLTIEMVGAQLTTPAIYIMTWHGSEDSDCRICESENKIKNQDDTAFSVCICSDTYSVRGSLPGFLGPPEVS